MSRPTGASHSCWKATLARTSGCDWTRKSRFMSKPFAFRLVPAVRPSGFAVGITTTMAWSRRSSTVGFVPVGEGDQVADDLHHGVGPLLLVPVDVRRDDHRELHVRAPGGEEGLGLCGVGEHEAA